ncbi:MAG: hypothetical protein CMH63_02085 [Nanoarchaeota archaeon]|nr:hypothetical protein [Nanoarchaeota archaeon]
MINLYLSKEKKIYYNFINKKSKKPVLVFLHGLGVNWTVWKPILEYFKKQNHPILYQDLRGHGKNAFFDSYQLEDFAQDLNEILNKEKIKKVILIGHSLEGMISLIFYKFYKSKLKKLILLNTTYKNPIPKWYLYFIGPIDRFITKIVTHTFLKKLYKYRDFSKLKNNSNFTLVLKNMFYRREMQFECIKNITNLDLTSLIKQIKIPTLIIASTKDELFSPKIEKRMHKYIKTSKLEILKGTHALPLKKAELIAKEIQDFIK